MGYRPWGRKESDTTRRTLVDADNPWHSLARGSTGPVSASVFTRLSSLCVSQSLFSLHIRTQSLN